MSGCQTIVERDDFCAAFQRQHAQRPILDFQVTHHPAAAVKVEQQWRVRAPIRIVPTCPSHAGAPGNIQIAHALEWRRLTIPRLELTGDPKAHLLRRHRRS